MIKLVVTAEISIEDGFFGDSWDEEEAFFSIITDEPLIVHSNEIGDSIGEMRIQRILSRAYVKESA